MQLVDVGALAGAEAEMMQADALLLECRALVFGRRRADPDGSPAADAIIGRLGIDDGFEPQKRQQLAVEFARNLVVRGGQICATPLISIISPWVIFSDSN